MTGLGVSSDILRISVKSQKPGAWPGLWRWVLEKAAERPEPPRRSGRLFRRDRIGVGQIIVGRHLVVIPAEERGQRLGIGLDAFDLIDRRRIERIFDRRGSTRLWPERTSGGTGKGGSG